MCQVFIGENCTERETTEAALRNGLWQYNMEATEGLLPEPGISINLIARNEEGRVIGGIVCETYLKCMEINVLWVDRAYRKQGLGYRLMEQAESKAKQAGCLLSHTSTYSFQAPDFYIRQGYEVCGVIDGFPNDIKLYSLKKKLLCG